MSWFEELTQSNTQIAELKTIQSKINSITYTKQVLEEKEQSLNGDSQNLIKNLAELIKNGELYLDKTLNYIISRNTNFELWKPLYDRLGALDELLRRHIDDELMFIQIADQNDVSCLHFKNHGGELAYQNGIATLFIKADEAYYNNTYNTNQEPSSKFNPSNILSEHDNYIKLWGFDIRFWKYDPLEFEPIIKNESILYILFGKDQIMNCAEQNKIVPLVDDLRMRK